MTFNCWKFKGGKSKECSVCVIALLSFIAGSLSDKFTALARVYVGQVRLEARAGRSLPSVLLDTADDFLVV